jgi:hypothetical protein
VAESVPNGSSLVGKRPDGFEKATEEIKSSFMVLGFGADATIYQIPRNADKFLAWHGMAPTICGERGLL